MATAPPSPVRRPAAPDTMAKPEQREHPAADAAMAEYVGYLASWFDIGQLAAGFRARREHETPPHHHDA